MFTVSTVVDIPQNVFEESLKIADESGVSINDFYETAISSYLIAINSEGKINLNPDQIDANQPEHS